MYKAYRYRLYPNKTQATLFHKTFGCVRFIYNQMLADRQAHYERTGQRLNNTPARYKDEYPWLKEVDSHALSNAQMSLNKAFNNYWRNPKHFGKPQFKRKKSYCSYSTNNQNGTVRIEGEKVRLPKVGWVKIRLHRPLMENSTIKTVTINKTSSGKYYISILVEYANQILPIIPQKYLGLDYAMNGLYVASDEEAADYSGFLRKNQKRLVRAQKKLSKKEKGSHNREKQRIRLAKLHEIIANQRQDYLHKKTRYLADHYDVIGVEDISVKAMAIRKKGRKFSYGKSVADNSWQRFVSMLQYKLAWQGKQLIRVDKWYPSTQLCHVCGYKADILKDLSVREWDCPNCGTHHNRDKNAAINIRNEARRIST